ncbi:hypothetical protein SLA2020_035250 [Shorea laevis]
MGSNRDNNYYDFMGEKKASSSSSDSKKWSFKKKVVKSDVDHYEQKQLHLKKKHVEENILPHLSDEEKEILRKGEKGIEIQVADAGTGDRYTMKLLDAGSFYLLKGTKQLLSNKNIDLRVGQEIEFTWRDAALYLSL